MTVGTRAWNQGEAMRMIDALAKEPGALMPILHVLNDNFGHVPDEAVPLIAQALNLTRADVVDTVQELLAILAGSIEHRQ